MQESKIKNLDHAKLLMYQGKFDEALEIIEFFKEKVAKDSKELLSALTLKGRVLSYVEKYKEAVEVGEQAYTLSQKLGRVSDSIDALLIKSFIIFFGKSEEAFDQILEAEKLFNSVYSEISIDQSRQKADLLLIKSIFYRIAGDVNKSYELGLQWLTFREKLGEKLDIARAYCHIGEVYLLKGEPNIALDYGIKSLDIQKELNNQVGIATSLSLVGLSYYSKSEFDQALKFSKQSLTVNKISTFTKHVSLHLLGAIYREKGELDKTLSYYNQAVTLAENEDYNEGYIENIMGIGAIYRMKGDHNLATEYLKRSLELSENIKSLYGMNASLYYLVLLNLDKNTREQAYSYLSKLKELVDQTGSKIFNQMHQIAKALYLKNSGRIRNRTEAENLLKQIVEDDIASPRLYFSAMVNLCDLFLEELYMTNNPEVLGELNPLIAKILKISENQRAYLWLAETKLLQAKLALIQMDIEEAKRLFTQAQQIAEFHGLTLLAIKISSEHDNLLDQLNEWDKLKAINAPMSERIQLASFDGVVDRMQGKRAIETPKLIPELPVFLLIIGEGGFPLFSNQFTEKYTFEEGILSGFLSAFNSFSSELFSKALDRAKFGEYKILMQAVSTFSVCYLFKGQTYLAKQKLNQFIVQIQSTTSIWHTLNKFYKANQIVELKDVPSLDSIISEIFII